MKDLEFVVKKKKEVSIRLPYRKVTVGNNAAAILHILEHFLTKKITSDTLQNHMNVKTESTYLQKGVMTEQRSSSLQLWKNVMMI